MLIFALEDEPLLLRRLSRTISEVMPEAEVMTFTRASAAMQAIEGEGLKPDIVFLDIEMPGMSGMEFAEKLTSRDKGCRIVFCTSYAQYAVEAISLHMEGHLGYLIKPITVEAVRREIRHILGKEAARTLLRAKCFGGFEVYAGDELLSFKRSRTKELLAFLIDRNGSSVTAKQICAQLWDDGTNDKKNLNYLYQLFDDLRNTLHMAGAEAVLQRSGYSYYVEPALIECDYYDYLRSGKPEFHGEYMTQYSWGEETCARLLSN